MSDLTLSILHDCIVASTVAIVCYLVGKAREWCAVHNDVKVRVEDESLDFKDDVDHGECWNARIVVEYNGIDFVTVRGIDFARGFGKGLKFQTSPMRIEKTIVKGAATSFVARVAAIEKDVPLPDRLKIAVKIGCNRLVGCGTIKLDRLRPARKAVDR